mgnify:CR=1|tara:strand:+ start:1049 stop:1246 length:198 start_codon:yes stop_codon:yes gene_type:complete
MTRKHFILIAEIISKAHVDGILSDEAVVLLADRLTNGLADTNTLFDKMKFYHAATNGIKIHELRK